MICSKEDGTSIQSTAVEQITVLMPVMFLPIN